jgi:signal transduction histidine kinase
VVTLENNKLFSLLSPEELKKLKLIASEQTFQAGQEIFKEGDPGDGIYLVREGLVEISFLGGEASSCVLTEARPGDLLGEMAVIDDKPRSASAVARKDTVVYFMPRAQILEFIAQSPGLALALLRDISHRLRTFNGQYLREVLQADRLAVVGRFARSIVHDLKNPLNIIGLTAEMAAVAENTPGSGRKAMVAIRQQVDRINDLVSEILDFTQGTAPDLVLPPLNYAQFVQDILPDLRDEATLKASSIELENQPPSISLPINPKRLRRLFFNLVHNATDAMPRGGRIILRFRSSAEELVTEVEDTGPGIAPEIADHLFEAFATYGKANGTGLGLSICKKIIADHHGWITTRTETGRGAIFEFAMPLPPPHQA